jgi:hypothetical protein
MRVGVGLRRFWCRRACPFFCRGLPDSGCGGGVFLVFAGGSVSWGWGCVVVFVGAVCGGGMVLIVLASFRGGPNGRYS